MKFLETWKCKGILQRSGKWNKGREWSGNLCSQGYLKGMAHTDGRGLVTTAMTSTAANKSSVTAASVAVNVTE